MYVIRERHFMALISMVYSLILFGAETSAGTAGYLYNELGAVLLSLFELSFILAAVFLAFYPAKAYQLFLAALPQFVYSFFIVDYFILSGLRAYQAILVHFALSFVFLFLIYLRYNGLIYGHRDNKEKV